MIPCKPIGHLLGQPDEPIACRVIADDISVHWWSNPMPEDRRCICGDAVRRDAEAVR